jgi:ubiquinone/menaquinone biosynthesis C-methylase UbiE
MTESRIYFAQVAREWDELRSGFFTEGMRDAAIAKVKLPANATVADVGTGSGFVLQGLLDKAVALTGYDESPEMLDQAAKRFARYPHVRLVKTDGRTLPAADNSYDAVFANMFLHHAPHPQQAIEEMARILKPGGTLVITDLDSHNQAWMAEAMADRWLGFDRSTIRRWYERAGLDRIDIDCAEGTCDCSAPGGEAVALSIFVALGRKAGDG